MKALKDTLIVVQARMESTRLPGKVLKTILGRPMIFYLLERLKSIPCEDLIVCISDALESLPLQDYLKAENVQVVTGHPTNVYARFLKAIQNSKAKALVRVTADNPLTDCEVIPRGIKKLLEEKLDWVWMSSCPVGCGSDIFSMETFLSFAQTTLSELEQEHLVPIFRNRPGLKNAEVVCDFKKNTEQLRLTVDTAEDFDRMNTIFTRFYKNAAIDLKKIVENLTLHA